jgi:predicted nucleic acid-binding protein
MGADVFVDTSGFYALLAARDPHHAKAAELLKEASASGTRFFTTDYVLDGHPAQSAELGPPAGCFF